MAPAVGTCPCVASQSQIATLVCFKFFGLQEHFLQSQFSRSPISNHLPLSDWATVLAWKANRAEPKAVSGRALPPLSGLGTNSPHELTGHWPCQKFKANVTFMSCAVWHQQSTEHGEGVWWAEMSVNLACLHKPASTCTRWVLSVSQDKVHHIIDSTPVLLAIMYSNFVGTDMLSSRRIRSWTLSNRTRSHGLKVVLQISPWSLSLRLECAPWCPATSVLMFLWNLHMHHLHLRLCWRIALAHMLGTICKCPTRHLVLLCSRGKFRPGHRSYWHRGLVLMKKPDPCTSCSWQHVGCSAYWLIGQTDNRLHFSPYTRTSFEWHRNWHPQGIWS